MSKRWVVNVIFVKQLCWKFANESASVFYSLCRNMSSICTHLAEEKIVRLGKLRQTHEPVNHPLKLFASLDYTSSQFDSNSLVQIHFERSWNEESRYATAEMKSGSNVCFPLQTNRSILYFVWGWYFYAIAQKMKALTIRFFRSWNKQLINTILEVHGVVIRK